MDNLADELERARKQAEHIRRIASALARAVSVSEMAHLVANECKAALSSDAVCVFLRTSQQFEMAGEVGCTEEFKSRCRVIPLSVIPFESTEGDLHEELFFGLAEEFKARIPGVKDLVDKSGRQTIAYAPLVVNQSIIGMLGFSFNRKQEQPAEKKFVMTLVNLCAQALERSRLIETERAAQREAEAASRAKSDFLSNISHEIRTPLGVILGFVELLMESNGLTSEQRKWISLIRRNTNQLTGIIGEVLDISRIEAGEVEVQRSYFSLPELLCDVETIVGLKADEKGIELVFHSENLPAVIYSDGIRLRQILVNLIGNAVKFTPRGRVDVNVRHSSEAGLEVTVKDTGIGIPVEQQMRIFEPFTQAESSTQRRFGGTGLGLSISKKLATVIGGDVALLESCPGRGSTFLFQLQNCSEPSAKGNGGVPCANDAVGEGDESPRDLEGYRILIVDDSPDNQDLIRHLLEHEGAVVDVADSAASGVEMALKDSYRIVIMDIQMPEIDGYEAVAMLRDQNYLGPVVALSAHVIQSARAKSINAGFNAYLTKPIDRPTLVASLKRLGSSIACSADTASNTSSTL